MGARELGPFAALGRIHAAPFSATATRVPACLLLRCELGRPAGSTFTGYIHRDAMRLLLYVLLLVTCIKWHADAQQFNVQADGSMQQRASAAVQAEDTSASDQPVNVCLSVALAVHTQLTLAPPAPAAVCSQPTVFDTWPTVFQSMSVMAEGHSSGRPSVSDPGCKLSTLHQECSEVYFRCLSSRCPKSWGSNLEQRTQEARAPP